MVDCRAITKPSINDNNNNGGSAEKSTVLHDHTILRFESCPEHKKNL